LEIVADVGIREAEGDVIVMAEVKVITGRLGTDKLGSEAGMDRVDEEVDAVGPEEPFVSRT
jgi:hypothetical protein